MKPKKQKHKSKFSYYHDIIPIGYEFSISIRFIDDKDQQFFQRQINFGRHMWIFTEFRKKGWYVQYDISTD